jgi:hypothetical protein
VILSCFIIFRSCTWVPECVGSRSFRLLSNLRRYVYFPFWRRPGCGLADGAAGGGFAPAGIGIFSVVCGMLLSLAIPLLVPGLEEVMIVYFPLLPLP